MLYARTKHFFFLFFDKLHAKTKRIVREKVMKKEIEVTHVPSIDQLVDVFIKAIPSA